ncbi:MAG TPA: biopolymer transporter ExbD [Cytophagales bacterium]|nr:biopolymer transporter ExbD [Cytophagales bacterium]
MAMNLRRKNKVTSEVNTSALNDIMFFLLLFFLIASTMVNPNVIKLLLPNSKSGQAVTKTQVSVSITKDLRYYINKEEVSLGELESRLTSLVQNSTEPTVVLRIDNSIQVQKLVDILDIGSRLKIKMILATKTK